MLVTSKGVFIFFKKGKISNGFNTNPFEAAEFFPMTSTGFGSGLKAICHYRM